MAEKKATAPIEFSGHIYIYQAFDIGDDIDLQAIEKNGKIKKLPLDVPKYFKNAHQPINVELPHPHATSSSVGVKIYNFGVISLTYKIPIHETLTDLRKSISDIQDKYQEQSVSDANTMFKKIKRFIAQPKFFHQNTSYMLIQIDSSDEIKANQLKEQYGFSIASLLRFEKTFLSEYQKNEIIESDIGYFRGDLLIIDSGVAFIYDKEYKEILYLFEYANVQQVELQYFDRQLDQQLNAIYERKVRPMKYRAYLPFIGTSLSGDLVGELGRLKVDISVITEQLENSIKLADEPYFSEIYSVLSKKLDLKTWHDAIEKKLDIILDIRTVYQSKIDNVREDLLTVAIIVLILVELIVAFFK